MKRNKIALFILTVCVFNIFLAGNMTTFVAGNESYEDTIAGVITKNVLLQSNFFDSQKTHAIQQALQGVGQSDDDLIDIVASLQSYADEKCFATAAFYRRFLISGSSITHSWAEASVWEDLNSGFTKYFKLYHEEGMAAGDRYDVIENMIGLEFLSNSFRDSQNLAIKTLIAGIFNQRKNMEANSTPGYDGPTGAGQLAYWTEIKGAGGGLTGYSKSQPDGSDYYKYCLAETSFWAIAGMLNYGMAIRGSVTDIDENLFNQSVTDAKAALAYLEDELFINGTGFIEHKAASKTTLSFKIQALACLAYARLYQATREQSYIDRVDNLILNTIARYFVDSARKGVINSFDLSMGTGSDLKIGYDNALYAYALIELYKATGIISYLNRAVEVLNFMNNYMFKKSSDNLIQGYVEYVTRKGEDYNPAAGSDLDPAGQINADARLWRTNAIVMIVNEEVYYAYLPWYIKYIWWEIIIAIAIVAVVVIIILIKKRGKRGTELSKTVKALID